MRSFKRNSIQGIIARLTSGAFEDRIRVAEENRVEVEIEREMLQETERSLEPQWRRALARLNRRPSSELLPQIQEDLLFQTRMWLSAAIVFLITEISSATLLVRTYVQEMSITIAGIAAALLSLVLAVAAKVVLLSWVDEKWPEEAIRRLKWMSGGSMAVFVLACATFFAFRNSAEIGLLFGTITSVGGVALAIGAGACWSIATLKAEPNKIAKKYDTVRRRRRLFDRTAELIRDVESVTESTDSEDDSVSGARRDPIRRSSTRGSTFLSFILITLLASCTPGQSPETGIETSRFRTLAIWPDVSASQDSAIVGSVLDDLFTAPRTTMLAEVRRIEIHPWSEPLSVFREPSNVISLNNSNVSPDCTGPEAQYFKAVARECQEKRSADLDVANRRLDELLGRVRENQQLWSLDGQQTCLRQVLQRVAQEPERVLNVVATDGKHDCGEWPSPGKTIKSRGSLTVVVIMPSKTDSTQAIEAVEQRAARIAEFFPAAVTIRPWELQKDWTWIDGVLSSTNRAIARGGSR